MYVCNCERYCKGQKTVRRTTYFAHAQYRNPHSEFSAEFWEYLRTTPVVFCPSQNPRKRVNRTSDATVGGLQTKRLHQQPDDSNDGDDVGGYLIGIYYGANRSGLGWCCRRIPSSRAVGTTWGSTR